MSGFVRRASSAMEHSSGSKYSAYLPSLTEGARVVCDGGAFGEYTMTKGKRSTTPTSLAAMRYGNIPTCSMCY